MMMTKIRCGKGGEVNAYKCLQGFTLATKTSVKAACAF